MIYFNNIPGVYSYYKSATEYPEMNGMTLPTTICEDALNAEQYIKRDQKELSYARITA